MKKNLLFSALLFCAFILNAQTPPADVPETPLGYPSNTNRLIEYIPGNIPVVISAPHGGKETPSNLPNRSGCGTNEEDNNTDILIREIQKQCYAQMGGYPHIIINNLRRSKLDPNRIESVATCNNAVTVPYFTAYNDYIDDAVATIMADYGKGLYIDLHGQSHTPVRIDVGYNISTSTLDVGPLSNSIDYSTIENLKNDNLQNLTLDELVRGSDSFGQLLQTTGGGYYNTSSYNGSSLQQCGRTVGYRAVPSNYNNGGCDDTTPNGSAYFAGDYYSNVRHGSGDTSATSSLEGGGSLNGGGGTIDGMMTEVNRRVRDLGTIYAGSSSYNRTDSQSPRLYYFAQDYATVIVDYIDAHYNDFTEFNYASASYDVADADPTPTIAGISGGTFSSTPTGLAIDSSNGEIDVSASTLGNYDVTYTSVGNDYYQTTKAIEITDNTLSVDGVEDISFQLFPNPTNGLMTLKGNGKISQVKIYSMIGQKVKGFTINSNKAQLDLSSLKTGSYMATFISEGQIIDSKLILRN